MATGPPTSADGRPDWDGPEEPLGADSDDDGPADPLGGGSDDDEGGVAGEQSASAIATTSSMPSM